MTVTSYLGQVEAVVQAVEIDSPTSFTWFGAPSPRLPAHIRRSIASAVARGHLLFTLRNHLYNNFYRVGFAAPVAPEVGEPWVSCQETQLAAELSRANAGRGYLERGWKVRAVVNGMVAVRRRGLEVWLTRNESGLAPDAHVVPGAEIAVWLPKESFDLSPGYYSAMSDEPFVWDENSTLVRVYWNVAPQAAARLLGGLTRRLNAARRPYRLKILSDTISYSRCDTGVLYMLKDDLLGAGADVAAVHAECGDGMREGVPAFTKKIGAGVALAEDVAAGDSFGQHRCEVLAEGLIRAYERGEQRVEARVATVASAFAQAGIDLERPYLRPSSVDDYLVRLGTLTGSCRRSKREAADASPETFLGVGAGIGKQLVTDAVWHRGQCNWLGLLPHAVGAREIRLSYGALGADLYDGTSGIALFLAMLYALTGDEATRRTAVGAVRQALAGTDRVPRVSLGLYTGATGIAVAAASVSALVVEPSLAAQARRLVRRVAADAAASDGFDLLSGRAGAIVALVVLHDMLGDEVCVDLARRLGDDLVGSARQTRRGWSWKSDVGPASRDLTGLSHGSAGAGHALLELFALTGDPRYAEAADGAFRYERSWFSREAMNWPDFREHARASKGGATFRTQWCHGAAGIALTRLRAHELLGDSVYRDEAAAALTTTDADTAAALDQGSLSFCLCHGLGGNADILLEARQRCAAAHLSELPEEIGRVGTGAYAQSESPWPCGIPVPGRETQGLMLGLAGIGHFYLRLAFPQVVPTLLLLRRHEFRRGIEAVVATRDARKPEPSTFTTVAGER